jgi:hypothetical protein
VNSYRITKYNPIFRDRSGAYTRDEWISWSDIGQVFYGVEFKKEDYLLTEANYINAVLSIMDRCAIPELKVARLEFGPILDLEPDASEKGRSAHFKLVDLGLASEEMRDAYFSARDGAWIKGAGLRNTMQLVLRELLWCKLVFPRRFFVHFGYDYYMYLGCRLGLGQIRETVADQTLFVEPFKSPFLR